MSDIEIDLDVIGRLPGPMRGHGSALAAASTLPSPDTGTTTGATRVAIDHVSSLARSFADDLDALADGLDLVLAQYDTSDGHSAWGLNFYGEGIYE